MATAALLNAVVRAGGEASKREDDPVVEAALAALRALIASHPAAPHPCEQLAILQHNLGRLDVARRLYAEVTRLDPPRLLDDQQRRAIECLCPVLRTTVAECFPLRDCAAIHHPKDALIGYHFFWEDDWDYPDDDEPCDHEVAWVRYRPTDLAPVEVVSYFHGRILTGQAPRADARPTVCVQWGKHGSVPEGCAGREEVEAVLRRDFQSSSHGGRVPNHPLKQRWPPRFPGAWEEYVCFDRLVDPLPRLRDSGWLIAGRWVNAILHDFFVPYNFHAKREWPDDGLSNL
ncbi:MAG TPA: hypothetical protein VKV57_12120 [bacterium]|nr:hypothetical protein [bacterium]